MRTDSLEKIPDAGKDGRQEDKTTTEDEMVRWYHRLNGHEFEQAPGVGDAIQPSHLLSSPSPPAPQSFPDSGYFPMSQLFA